MNYTNFSKSRKNAIEYICISMNVQDITTPRQEKNGTTMLYDPISEAKYTLHTNGYIRRYTQKQFWPYSGQWVGYQLNRTKKVFGGTERIMASADEQIVILINAIVNYRTSYLKCFNHTNY